MKRLHSWSIMLAVAMLVTSQVAMAEEKEAKPPPEAVQDLYGIVVALLQNTVDADNALPPMQDAEAAKKAIWPYSQNESRFINSQTGDKYQPNAAVSEKKLSTLKDKKVVLFYEPKPSADGKRWVLFLPKADKNGDFDLRGNHNEYVKQVSEDEWKNLQLDPGG